jgi:hypothetical protein
METILVIILILVLVGALPSWPYSRGWGYGPSILGLILLIGSSGRWCGQPEFSAHRKRPRRDPPQEGRFAYFR